MDEQVLNPTDNVAIKIADFGLARSQESEPKNEMTNTLGTYVIQSLFTFKYLLTYIYYFLALDGSWDIR